MTRTSKTLLAALAAASSLVSANVQAGSVAWNIDETQSKISLAIADTAVNLDGTNATIRIRNQSGGNSGPWNVGNTAFMDGTLNTIYTEGSGIQFLPAAPGDIVGLASGSYRPNPNSWDPNNTNAENPDGQYSGTTTDPSVFGERVRATVSILTVDAGYLAIDDVSYDAQSGLLGITGNTFAASGINFGILESLIYFDGLSIIIVGQPIPDTFASPFDNFVAANNGAGAGTITDLGGLDRKLTIPINMVLALDISGIVLNASVTGQVVAYATVPEPSSFALLGLSGIGLAVQVYRRRRAS